jgi:Holliday junction resolvasome RuvABC endonuclease subunit
MKKLLFLFIVTGIVACSTVKTAYDYDKQADFSKYKTYSLTQDDLLETVGQLNKDRILNAVESELSKKGFNKSDTPDALVDIHIKTQQKVTATASSTGAMRYGRYGYGGGFGTTNISYDEYTDGTMLITLIDNNTQKIIWQGSGAKTLSEDVSAEKREQNITSAVQQILLNYPPKK